MKKMLLLTIFSLMLAAIYAQSPVYFEPSACEATLAPGDSAVVHSVLHNATDHTIEFYFPGYTSKDQGGPDGYGYSWIDSEEPGGPEWAWTDISENGDQVEGLGDDQVAGPFTLPFTFPFYGQEKNHYWISSNGVISFNEQMIPFANGPIPQNSNYIDFIAWFWDDLMIDTAISRVYVKNYDEKTVVQFTKMVHFPGSESFITGQVIMMVNGSILIKYRQVSENFETTSATTGLQSWNPEMGLQVAYNQEYVHSELAVRFDLQRNFITSVTPSSLVLLPDQQETIWVAYSSEGFTPGGYEQELKCITNWEEIPNLFLHNVMHVTNPNQGGFKGYVTDAATGFAIAEVTVKVGEHQTYTNSNGYYELPLETGEYNVKFMRNGYQTLIVEDTTALPGFSVLDVELNAFYFMAGRVFAGDNPIESGFAYWYKLVEETIVDIDADLVGVEGWFEFTNLSAGNYMIKAEPSPTSVYYGDYLPTYYGDVIHWEDATVFNLVQSTDDIQIHLVPVTLAPQGPGSISGTIYSSVRMADVPVILRTAGGTAVMTLSATDGSFGFTDLAFGTYEIFAEIPGKSIIPMTIVLDLTNPLKENVDMLVAGNEIIFTGIQESEVFDMMPDIYPVPARDKFNVMISLKKPSVVNLTISDPAGRTVSVESYHITGQDILVIDVSDLTRGVYIMKLEANQEVVVRKVIKD